ncbi:MAG: PH domain-containing protein [Candidatus Eremiobacteraeota bacterium]|nr:PH domain-containing protein [Candidatus Eremiobacteraeota bacterium]
MTIQPSFSDQTNALAVAREVSPELDPDEKLLWAGQPRSGVLFQPYDWFTIPFALVWTGFVFTFEISAIRGGAPLFFVIWGIPFVVVGLYNLIGRFVYDASLRSRTFYAVTNRAAIIVTTLFGRKVRILGLSTMTDLTLDEKDDGWGTIYFGSAPPQWTWFQSSFSRPQVPCFAMIRDARQVYNTIMTARQEAA